VRDQFPFPGYILPDKGHLHIAATVARYLRPGAKVLDFGAGPCDKTAVIASMGYDCTAYDDLADPWHYVDDNREKILSFARDLRIQYVTPDGSEGGPLEGPFDMLMMHDVLEHLHDSPRDLLSKFLDLVRPGGYLFATVPNAVNIRKRLDVLRGQTNLPNYEAFFWNVGAWRGHVREYTHDDCDSLAKYMGLEVVELRSCHHMLEKTHPRIRPVYEAVTKVFPGWRDTWSLVAQKPESWNPPQDQVDRTSGPGIGHH